MCLCTSQLFFIDKLFLLFNFGKYIGIIFRNLYESYDEKQESKMKCITRYFHRISSTIPVGVVSFERKVLPLEGNSLVPYGKVDFWSKSAFPLCHLEVTVETNK